jgi:hypothetical protein
MQLKPATLLFKHSIKTLHHRAHVIIKYITLHDRASTDVKTASLPCVNPEAFTPIETMAPN